MSTLVAKPAAILATNVRSDAEKLYVLLVDGREVSVPLEWFPKLRDATEKQRQNWRLIGGGVDEDISVAGLLE